MSTVEPDEVEARAAALLAALARHRVTLASVESLTGGMFASAVTAVPGASVSYLGGFVTYATRLKHELVGVDADQIAEIGVINAATAEAMAEGGRERTGADLSSRAQGLPAPTRRTASSPARSSSPWRAPVRSPWPTSSCRGIGARFVRAPSPP